jgi:uncharacterized protein
MNTPDYMDRIRTIIFDEIGDRQIRVFLFGSRTGQNSRPASDVDIALLGPTRLDRPWLADLRDRLEESTVPYHVDIVDMNVVKEDFRKAVLPGALEWKRPVLKSTL